MKDKQNSRNKKPLVKTIFEQVFPSFLSTYATNLTQLNFLYQSGYSLHKIRNVIININK